jgi:hypothetical protein
VWRGGRIFSSLIVNLLPSADPAVAPLVWHSRQHCECPRGFDQLPRSSAATPKHQAKKIREPL